MNQSLNDSKSTITLEEELNEDYEPTHQEVRQYAQQLGMQLPEDNQYLDIARAGLKAKLPEEWKPCQKLIDGQEIVFYKNVQTNEVTQEHPCDFIYKKKYQDAKIVDQKSKPKKATGINKLKQNIQQYRHEEPQQHSKPGKSDLLEGPDDQSFLVESNTFNNNNSNQPAYVLQNPSTLLSNSATQQLFQAVDFEFVNQLQSYDEKQKEQIQKLKEENKQKLSKMELMLMNEADPELFELKEEYSHRMDEQKKEFDEKQIKIKKKLEEEIEQNLIKQRNNLSKQIDRKIEDAEYQQDKEIKNKLRLLEQELQESHKDIIKKINQRQKEINEQDSKQGKQIMEKKKQVDSQFLRYKQQVQQQFQDQFSKMDQELNRKIQTEKEQIKKKITLQSEDQIRNYRSDIMDAEESYTKMIRQIRQEIKDQYEPKFKELQDEFSESLQNLELSESQILNFSVSDYKEQQKKMDQKQIINLKKEQLIAQLQQNISDYGRTIQEKYQNLRIELEESKRSKLQQIQKDLEKRTGKKMGDGKEIDLCMEINQTRTQLQELQEQIKKLKKVKQEIDLKYKNLYAVYIKYDLEKELQQIEIVKYELNNKKFIVEQLQTSVRDIDQQVEQIEKTNQQIQKKNQEQQQKQSQFQNVLNSVNEIKEILIVGQNNDSKIQYNQSGFSTQQFNQQQQQQQQQESILQTQYPLLQSIPPVTDISTEIRKWKSILLEEQVKLNREKENLLIDKDKIKQLERKLLLDQENVKREIHITKQLNQNGMKKDILKKMKSEVQHQLLQLSETITKLNTRRTLMKSKGKALESMDKGLNENQINVLLMNQQYSLYCKIGVDEENNEIEELENQSKINESYFQQIKILSQEQPSSYISQQPVEGETNILELINQQCIPLKINFPLGKQKMMTYTDESKTRLELIEQKDLIQNMKYRLTNTNGYNEDSRQKLQRYQQYLQCKN